MESLSSKTFALSQRNAGARDRSFCLRIHWDYNVYFTLNWLICQDV